MQADCATGFDSKSTAEAFDIALKVYDVIVKNIDVKIENPTEKPDEGNGNESIEAGDSDETKGGESNESGEGKDKIELTPAQKRQLENVVFLKIIRKLSLFKYHLDWMS